MHRNLQHFVPCLLATELGKGEKKEPALEIEAHQARCGVEGDQPDMQLLAAIEAAKVGRLCVTST